MIVGIVSGIVAVVSLCVAFVLLTRLEQLQIRDVHVEGSQSVSTEEVSTAAHDLLDGYYIGLIPRSNLFFYPKREMERVFIVKYPRLSDVKLSRTGRTVTVTFVERAPVAIVCDGSSDASADTCFFSDDTGYLLAKAPNFSGSSDLSGSLYHMIRVEQSRVEVGSVPITPTLLVDILRFTDGLVTRLNLPVRSITLRADGDIVVDTEANTDIFLRSTDSLDTALRNLTLFLDETRLRARAKKTVAVFSQIDLRYGNAVYYKVPVEQKDDVSADSSVFLTGGAGATTTSTVTPSSTHDSSQ